MIQESRGKVEKTGCVFFRKGHVPAGHCRQYRRPGRGCDICVFGSKHYPRSAVDRYHNLSVLCVGNKIGNQFGARYKSRAEDTEWPDSGRYGPADSVRAYRYPIKKGGLAVADSNITKHTRIRVKGTNGKFHFEKNQRSAYLREMRHEP